MGLSTDITEYIIVAKPSPVVVDDSDRLRLMSVTGIIDILSVSMLACFTCAIQSTSIETCSSVLSKYCLLWVNCIGVNCCTPSPLCSATLSGQDGEILLDYSKNIVSEKTMQLLFKLVSSCHSSALCGNCKDDRARAVPGIASCSQWTVHFCDNYVCF